MIKRIIFDVDETLLSTNYDCLQAYQEYFDSINVNIKAIKLYDLIGKYESDNGSFEKDDLEKYIQKHLYANFNMNDMLEIYGNHGTLKDKNIINTLDYLSKKYDIVVLTNWYVDSQSNRLAKANIIKYINNVYGIENAGLKPLESTFKVACDSYKPEECLMVGDLIDIDIIVPVKLGMNVYYCGNEDNVNYPRIKDISELEELL